MRQIQMIGRYFFLFWIDFRFHVYILHKIQNDNYDSRRMLLLYREVENDNMRQQMQLLYREVEDKSDGRYSNLVNP